MQGVGFRVLGFGDGSGGLIKGFRGFRGFRGFKGV